jgi:hypothetical protein
MKKAQFVRGTFPDRKRRWFIASQEPYRIKVTIVDNVRTGGKVKQEIVATLGTIDGLEKFLDRPIV